MSLPARAADGAITTPTSRVALVSISMATREITTESRWGSSTPVEAMVDPLHEPLQHARAVGTTYDLSPVYPWIDSFGWMGEDAAPTGAGRA